MIQDYVEKKTEKNIKFEDFKDSEEYKNAVQRAVKKVQDEYDKVKKELDDKNLFFKNTKIDETLYNTLKKVGDDKKWDLSNKSMIDIIIKGIKSDYDFDFDSDGNTIIKKDGKPIKDDLQNEMNLSDLFTNIGGNIFKELVDEKSSPQNKNINNKLKIEPFKDDLDYFNRVSAENDPEKLAAMKAQYELQNK
jgi:hypothetical protein